VVLSGKGLFQNFHGISKKEPPRNGGFLFI